MTEQVSMFSQVLQSDLLITGYQIDMFKENLFILNIYVKTLTALLLYLRI